MTATIPASGSSRETLLKDHTDQLCKEARLTVAARCDNTDDVRRIALMLGLIEADPSGALIEANPWDAERGDSPQDSSIE